MLHDTAYNIIADPKFLIGIHQMLKIAGDIVYSIRANTFSEICSFYFHVICKIILK